MRFFFCWGDTFLAHYDEFWPEQIALILRRANRLFRRRPHDDDLHAHAQILASIIPFEMYQYGLVLVLNQDLWTLEIAAYPPHAEPGERIRRARRRREQNEREEERQRNRKADRLARAAAAEARRLARKAEREAARAAADQARKAKQAEKAKDKKEKRRRRNDAAKRIIAALIQWLQPIISMLYNKADTWWAKFKQACRKVVTLRGHTDAALDIPPLTIRQQLSRWIVPSAEDCRSANIAAWKHDPLPRGAQRERRLFLADVFPIWLDTIAPIESMFVRDGRSLFGELLLESEFVS